MPFSQGFSRTELATTKSAKVTRDNELTSQEEFFLFALEAPQHRRVPEREEVHAVLGNIQIDHLLIYASCQRKSVS